MKALTTSYYIINKLSSAKMLKATTTFVPLQNICSVYAYRHKLEYFTNTSSVLVTSAKGKRRSLVTLIDDFSHSRDSEHL